MATSTRVYALRWGGAEFIALVRLPLLMDIKVVVRDHVDDLKLIGA